MALTQKMLKAMGIEDDQREQILDAHQETLDSIKKERDTYKAEAEKVQSLQRQLEEAEKAKVDPDEWREKYEDEHKAFEDFKTQVNEEKAEAEKAKAYRDMLKDAGIDPKRIDTIMKVTNLDDVEMQDGELKDADSLKESAKKEWADFVLKKETKGSDPANPPKGDGLPEGADPELSKRMQARHEQMFGKAD